MTTERSAIPSVAAAAACTILTFGSAFVAIRAALRSYGPAELAALRFVVASAALGALALVRPVRRPEASDWPRLAAAGTLGISAYALLINYGETHVGAGMASFVINTSPVFTAILAATILGERLPGTSWIGLGISLTGTSAIGMSTGAAFAFEPAVVWLLLAALAQAGYFTLQKPLARRYGAVSALSWMVWVGTLWLVPALPSALRAMARVPVDATLAVVYLAIAPTVVGYSTWAFAVARSPLGRLSALLYFVPPVATAIGWLALDERPTPLGIGGGCLALVGVLLVNLPAREVRAGATAGGAATRASGRSAA